MKHAVVVADSLPFPPVGGGQQRTHHLARALSTIAPVTFLGFEWERRPPTTPFPVAVEPVPWEPPPLYRAMDDGDPDVAAAAVRELAETSPEPWFVSFFRSDEMAARLRAVLANGCDTTVVFEGTDMGQYLSVVPDGVRTVLDLHNVESVVVERSAARFGDRTPHEHRRALAYEAALVREVDLVVTVSEVDADAVRTLYGVDAAVIPNGVDLAAYEDDTDVGDDDLLLFLGTMNYEPNVVAAAHLVGSILPRVVRRRPATTLHIVGARPTDEVLVLASRGVVVTGEVPDARPWLRAAGIVVVPVLHGGGTRFKILEAAAAGKAIVTTSVGLEGLDLRGGRDLIVADDVDDFAAAVVGLQEDRHHRKQLGAAARRAVRQYDWGGIERRFADLVSDLSRGTQ